MKKLSLYDLLVFTDFNTCDVIPDTKKHDPYQLFGLDAYDKLIIRYLTILPSL